MKFKDLKIGQSFDWIDDSRIGFNSFFLTCWRNSYRGYMDTHGTQHTVGSMNANVFHVGKYDKQETGYQE